MQERHNGQWCCNLRLQLDMVLSIAAGFYGIRADFTNSNFYFTGNQSNVLAPTGISECLSYWYKEFKELIQPRLYRGQNRSIESSYSIILQPLKNSQINYVWEADGTNGIAETDSTGWFTVNLTIEEDHELGNFIGLHISW